MPTPTRRFALGIGALAALLILNGVGMGVAVAEPDDPGVPPDSGQSSEPSSPSEPTSPVPSVPEVRSPLSQLRDFLQRPHAIFGNGRVPGQPVPVVVPETPGVVGVDPELIVPKPGDAPPAVPGESVEDEPKQTLPGDPVDVAPTARKPSGHTAEVRLPFSAPFTVPLPTRPGARATQFSIDLSDPFKALNSVNTSLNQLNTLISEAITPHNPFPPKPPQPTLRVMEEGPVADASGGVAGGGDGGHGGASGSDPMPPMPVLRAPMALPMPRIGPPRPIVRTTPAGAAAPVLGAGSAGVRTPEIKGSLAQTGSVPGSTAPPANTTSAGLSGTGNTAFRQGYPQYLRSARIAELAVVAIPGVAGLLVLTASGGVLGYRQANAGRFVRSDAARFLR